MKHDFVDGLAFWCLARLAILAACCTLFPVTARSESCSAANRLERFEGIELCIPPGNDRYQFERGHLTALYWLGDGQIPPPPGDDPTPNGTDLDMTVATVPFGLDPAFETPASTITASVSDAAEAKDANGTFEANVPIQGQFFRFAFESLDAGIVRGIHKKDAFEEIVIYLRSSTPDMPSHLVLCNVSRSKEKPSHMCWAFARLRNRVLTIFMAGKNVDRSFRLSEQVAADLNAFSAWSSSP